MMEDEESSTMSLRFSRSSSILIKNNTMETKVTMIPTSELSSAVEASSSSSSALGSSSSPQTGDNSFSASTSSATATTTAITTTSTDNNKHLRLNFSDFVDLQTRLVLLPRIEEEGLGAIISSFTPPPSTTTAGEEDETSSSSGGSSPKLDESSKEHRDDEEFTSLEKGCVLIGVGSSKDDCRNKDFTSILADIRKQRVPISLLFEKSTVPVSSVELKPNKEEETRTESSDHDSRKQPQQQPDSFQSGISALSAWGMRMRAQSERLAADAATSAAAMASAAKERARVLQQQQQQQQQEQMQRDRARSRSCEIFVQTTVGAFIPAKTAKKVTTSSLLLVRTSATEPCPSKGYSFQWFRSSSSSSPLDDVSSASGRSKSSDEGVDPEDLEWIELKGATNAAFQPDSTLVGRKLRCLVTLDPLDDNSSSDDSDMEDVELDSVEHEEILCEMPEAITADLTLFNGARQALARGAKFGGFQGRGNASGRQFGLEVSLGMKKRRHQPLTVSSVKIFQITGNERVPLTSTPLLQVTAHVDASSPKNLELIFQAPADSVLSALCTDGQLQLEAPNRLARESFLLALGVANYQGKPANLDAKTILYRDELKAYLDDASISSGSLSCASSFHSSQKSVSSQPLSSAGSVHSSSTRSSVVKEPETLEEFQKELAFLRSKLAKKDKVVSELQRQITQSDAAQEDATNKLAICQKELKEANEANQNLKQSMQSAEKKLHSHEASVLRMQGEHELAISKLENRISSQDEKIASLEKANRALQNEKAVLTAGIDARESKLTKMGELQSSYEKLSSKVAQHDALRLKLEESDRRYESIKEDLEKVRQLEQQWKSELETTKETVEKLNSRIQAEEKKAESALAQLEPLQKKNQQLKGERNSYKQKTDSLSKEISRLCRSGRSIKDIEKLISDHEALLEEVETLRRQKRKALEDAHMYRTSYEQSKVAQQASGIDYETQKALERNAELERLLAEMTEYINAKEMQLETYKQINEHLQAEIRTLAQANLGKNEI